MPVRALTDKGFLILCILGQQDPPEVSGLLSKRVLFNFTNLLTWKILQSFTTV